MALPSVRPALKNAFLLSLLTGLSAWYFTNFPLPYFLAHAKEFILFVLIWGGACGLGNRLLTFLQIQKFSSALEELVFTSTTGFGILSLLMILLGVLHGWTPAGTWTLLLVSLLLGRPFFVRGLSGLRKASNPLLLPRGHILPWAALGGGVLISLLVALAPITYYDSLVYHFALPSAYLKARHWVGLPELIYSAFPQALEMLWTFGMLIGNDTVSNLVAWYLALSLLMAVGSFGKRFYEPAAGLWAAALVAVMPAFLLLSSGGYVDIGLALFSFMALYAFVIWGQAPSRGLLILCGFFAGSAVGTKYIGAIPAVLLAAGVFAYNKRRSVQMRVQNFATYGLAALTVCGPWLVKNVLYVGNPVFPFFYHWGIQKLNPWLPQAAAGYFRGIVEYQPRTLAQLVALFVQIPLWPMGFGRGADVLGDLGWAPFLWFLPALSLCAKQTSTTRLLLGFAFLYFIPWGMSRPVLRFLLPLLPVLAVLVGVGWVQGFGAQSPWVRWIAGALMASLVLSGLFLFFWAADTFSCFPVALGLEDREHYLTRMLNYYGAASYANANLPGDAVLFIVGDQRGYYYQRRIMLRPVFSENPLVRWADEASSPEALHQKLLQEGLTHLVINHAEMERLRGYHFLDFSAKGEKNWVGLQLQLGRALYQDRSCEVLALQ